ncbi:HEAT repeat-containing protein 4 [Quaeritorhiza haematococci]|nr:HEAT repeat-containing protein 4 [Quaeritorhiza haematococci]
MVVSLFRTQVPAVRRPPRLPPSYQTQAKEINSIVAELKTLDKEEAEQARRQQATLRLRFEEDLQKDVQELHFGTYGLGVLGGGLAGNSHETLSVDKVDENFESVGEPNTNMGDGNSSKVIGQHKSSWALNLGHSPLLKESKSTTKSGHSLELALGGSEQATSSADGILLTDTIPVGSISPSSNSLPNKPVFRLKPSESFSTRNVPYMLEVWQRVEKVNVEAVLARYEREDAAKKAESARRQAETISRLAAMGRMDSVVGEGNKAETSRRGERGRKSRQHQRWQSRTAATSRTSSESRLDSSKDPNRLTSSTGQQTKQTISHSTIHLLRKLTKDGLSERTINPQPQQAGVGSTVATNAGTTAQNDIDKIVREVLTGEGIEFSVTNEQQGSSSVPPRLVKRRARGWRKHFHANQDGNDIADDFVLELSFPEIDELVEDALNWDVSVAEKTIGNTTTYRAASRSASMKDRKKGSTLFHESPSTIFQNDGIMRLRSGSGSLQLTAVHQPHSQYQHRKKEDFNIMRFAGIAKTSGWSGIVGSLPPESQMLTSPSKDAGVAVTAQSVLNDLIQRPWARAFEPPGHDSPDHTTLINVLVLALREGKGKDMSTNGTESSSPSSSSASSSLSLRPLRFEAARLLFKLKVHKFLTRWDAFAFRSTLLEMLQEGNSDERFFAASVSCRTRHGFGGEEDGENAQALAVIVDALGDVDEERRHAAKKILKNMRKEALPLVFEMLWNSAENTNWRTRQDVADLWPHLIERMSTMTPQTTVLLAKAGNSKEEIGGGEAKRRSSLTAMSKNVSHSNENMDSKNGSGSTLTDLEALRGRIHDQIVNQLLNLMWNDCSPAVRQSASKALTKLKMGRSVYEWIVNLLQSNDPTLRVDALQYLGQLKVLNASSLPVLIKSLQDHFASVRLEACKVVCLAGPIHERSLMNALLACCDDNEWMIRAYAIKEVDAVRVEAIHAVQELKLLTDDMFKVALQYLAEERSELVRREAELVLAAAGLSTDVDPRKANTAAAAVTASATSVYGPSKKAMLLVSRLNPSPNNDFQPNPSEMEVIMRDELVGEKERDIVIAKVKAMGQKTAVTSEIATGPEASYLVSLEFPEKQHCPPLRRRRIIIPLNINPAKDPPGSTLRRMDLLSS